MKYDENILACRKSYYNAARRFNSVQTRIVNGFDLLHDAICLSLEEPTDLQTAILKIRAKHGSKCRGHHIDFEYRYSLKLWKHVAGWNKKACLYFDQVNRILESSGYPIGQHAMNGGEKQFGHYAVDFYIPEYMVIVEYNEKAHYETLQKITRDNNRRLYLTKITNIPVIVIHEDLESEIHCAREIIRNIKYFNAKQEYV